MSKEVNLTFVGDILPSYNVLSTSFKKGGNPSNSEDYDFGEIFKNISPIIKRSDIALCNIEFSCGNPPYYYSLIPPAFGKVGYSDDISYNFGGSINIRINAPISFLESIKGCGFNCFELANNHTFDSGKEGVNNIIDFCNKNNIDYIGVRKNNEEFNKPLIKEINGIKIAFINATYKSKQILKETDIDIDLIANFKNIFEQINKAKNEKCDVIIFLPHWGTEYNLFNTEAQANFATKLFKHGVDIIIGSHPHVVQNSDIIDNKLCIYSIGNLVTGQVCPFTQISKIVNIKLIKNNIGEVEISYNNIYTWCAKYGTIGDNYSVIPIKEYISNPEKFRDINEYNKMIKEIETIKGLLV